jgi:hypothetical protein
MRVVILLSDEEMGLVPFWGMLIILTIKRWQVLHACILHFEGLGFRKEAFVTFVTACIYSGTIRRN